MRIDVIKNFVHLRVVEPSEFDQSTFRIKYLGTSGKIHIVEGRLKATKKYAIQAYRWRIRSKGHPGFTKNQAVFLAKKMMEKLKRKNYYCWKCRRRHYLGSYLYSYHKNVFEGGTP